VGLSTGGGWTTANFVEGATFGFALGLGRGFLAARNIDVEVKNRGFCCACEHDLGEKRKILEGLTRIDCALKFNRPLEKADICDKLATIFMFPKINLHIPWRISEKPQSRTKAHLSFGKIPNF
jgi:hypothetical protein